MWRGEGTLAVLDPGGSMGITMSNPWGITCMGAQEKNNDNYNNNDNDDDDDDDDNENDNDN